jgi:hypothetical protein
MLWKMRREHVLAFVMGFHGRLGGLSLMNGLGEDAMRMCLLKTDW